MRRLEEEIAAEEKAAVERKQAEAEAEAERKRKEEEAERVAKERRCLKKQAKERWDAMLCWESGCTGTIAK